MSFGLVFQNLARVRVDADLVEDVAAPDVERVAQSRSTRLLLEFLIGDLPGMCFRRWAETLSLRLGRHSSCVVSTCVGVLDRRQPDQRLCAFVRPLQSDIPVGCADRDHGGLVLLVWCRLRIWLVHAAHVRMGVSGHRHRVAPDGFAGRFVQPHAPKGPPSPTHVRQCAGKRMMTSRPICFSRSEKSRRISAPRRLAIVWTMDSPRPEPNCSLPSER